MTGDNMNNLVVTDVHFRDFKKTITYDELTMIPSVIVEDGGKIEYKLTAISQGTRMGLSYNLGKDSIFTFIGSITGMDNNGFIEVELLDIEEQIK
jgi:hypothetical protein